MQNGLIQLEDVQSHESKGLNARLNQAKSMR